MNRLPTLENLEVALLLEAVYQRFGYDFRMHRRDVLREKLHALLEKEMLPSLSTLQHRVLHEPDGIGLFLKGVAGRSAGLFGDGARMAALRHTLSPWLRSRPSPRIWIADCTCAEEVYPIVILLDEAGILDKTTIFATATHELMLEDAREAEISVECLPEYEENYRRGGGMRSLSYYCRKEDDRYVFSPALRERVTFAEYSLATDATFNEFEFISCPSVLNELARVPRQRAMQLFHDSLPVFGVLDAPDSENADLAGFGAQYRPLEGQQGLYRRVA